MCTSQTNDHGGVSGVYESPCAIVTNDGQGQGIELSVLRSRFNDSIVGE